MNTRLNFYGIPGAAVGGENLRSRLANRFQLKKKVSFIYLDSNKQYRKK